MGRVGSEVWIEVAPDGIKKVVDADVHRLATCIQNDRAGLPTADKSIQKAPLVREPALAIPKRQLISHVTLNDVSQVISGKGVGCGRHVSEVLHRSVVCVVFL